jgi:glycosyltransferase involved in cell wall biosynthesis
VTAPRTVVAFVVDADPAKAPDDRQVAAATRLGAALATGDHGVVAVDVRAVADWTADRTAEPGLRAVVTTSPHLDPALVPDDVPSIAWVIDDPEAWPAHPGLALFDAVLAGSELMRVRLSIALADVRRQGHGPLLDVLPLAAGAAAGAGGRPAAAGPARGLSRLLRRGASSGRAAPLPVQDAVQAAGGIVPAEVYEALAAGRLPQPVSRLGLAEVGLRALVPGPGDPERPDPGALRSLVATEHTWDVRAATLAGVLERLGPATAGDRPPRLGFFPDFRAGNPFQELLYGELVARGTRVAPIRNPTESLVLRDTGGDLRDYVLHVHWAEVVAQVVVDPDESAARLAAFKELLLGVKERGGHVVWTVHNVLPHDVRHRDVEIELLGFLAAHAELVHVLGGATVELTRPYYELRPAAVEVVPHSSYVGVYPDVISREVARKRLGLLPHDVALLCLGGIRPYRGLDTLLDAFDVLVERDLRVKLLVAGKPGRFPQVREWQERCERHPRIVSRFELVPESDLQLWHRAADVAVLPYRGILNSGAFKLAETFGLPIVAPQAGNLAGTLDPAYAVGFDPNVDGDLLRALEDAADLVTDPEAVAHARTTARAAAAAYPPQRMAADFADAMARRLGLDQLGRPGQPGVSPPKAPSLTVAARTGNES